MDGGEKNLLVALVLIQRLEILSKGMSEQIPALPFLYNDRERLVPLAVLGFPGAP